MSSTDSAKKTPHFSGPRPVPEEQQVGAGSERFSSFGQNEGYNNNNFGNQPQSRPNFRPVKFPKFPNFGKRPKFKPINFPNPKFPKFPKFGGGYGGFGGGGGGFHSSGGRVGVGHTNSPFGYLGKRETGYDCLPDRFRDKVNNPMNPRISQNL